jgi:hypothetical protein
VRRPTLETVLKFCQAYGLEPTDVLKLTAPSLPAAAAAFLRKPVKRKAPPPHPIGGGSNHDGTPLASLAETMSRLSDAVKNWLRSLWYVPVPLTTTV